MSVRDYAAALGKALGIGGEVILSSDPEIGTTIELPCARKHSAQFTIGRTHLPPEIVKKKLKQANWGVGRRLLCPDHNASERNVKRLVRSIMDPIQEIKEMTGTATPAEVAVLTPTSEEAREARRLATMLIDEKFDVAKGCYRDGYTDRKVAEETGVSEHFVTKRREEDFGPFKEPPEIAKARDELDALEHRVEELKKHSAQVVEALLRDIAAHRRNLTGLIAKNHWNN